MNTVCEENKCQEDKKFLLLVYLISLFIVAYSVYGVVKADYSFLYYVSFIVPFIPITYALRHRLKINFWVGLGAFFLAVFHMLGGFLQIEGHRLYDHFFFSNFKYDNFMHIYGSVIATFLIYNAVKYYFIDKGGMGAILKKNKFGFVFMIFLLVLGMGAIVEITELVLVLFVQKASVLIGDYMNNAFDLIYNAAGVVVALLVVYFYDEII